MSEPTQQRPKQQPAPAAGQPAEYDPYESQVEYLKSRGWRCLGDPNWPSADWLDPMKPFEDTYSLGPELTYEEVYEPERGKLLKRTKFVMGQDENGNANQRVRQVCVTNAVQGVRRQDALWIQMERDRAAAKAATTDQRRQTA